MKKLFNVMFLSFVVLAFNPALVQAQTVQAIQITTCQDLQNIGNLNYINANNQSQPEPFNGNYQLANDIDCSNTATWNNGQGFLAIGTVPGFTGNFTGTLSGLSNDGVTVYSIENLTIIQPQPSSQYPHPSAALFRDVYGANIK